MPPVGLGSIERRIRISEQSLELGAIARIDRSADAHADLDPLSVNFELVSNTIEETVGEFAGFALPPATTTLQCGIDRIRQRLRLGYHNKLIASDSGDKSQ